MSKFAVGEVAIIANTAWPEFFPVGMDVVILSIMSCNCCYYVDVPRKPAGCLHVTADDFCLRKKPQPPDWEKLCQLDDLPLVRPKEPA